MSRTHDALLGQILQTDTGAGGFLLFIIVAIFILAVLALWAYASYWVYNDAKERGASAATWAGAVFISGFVNIVVLGFVLLIWLAVRPDKTGSTSSQSDTGTGSSSDVGTVSSWDVEEGSGSDASSSSDGSSGVWDDDNSSGPWNNDNSGPWSDDE